MFSDVSDYFQTIFETGRFFNIFKDVFYYIGIFHWGILAIVVLFALILMLVCRLEKQKIYFLKPCYEKDILKQSAYTKAMNEMAVKQGFENCTWFRHCRGGVYQATATTWFSEDSLILLMVGGGKLCGINFKTTYLFSKTIGGPVILTCDQSGESDLSGLIEKKVLWNADLEELVNLHKTRLQSCVHRLEAFDSSSPLMEYESILRRKARILVDYDLAKYLGPTENAWRYTLKGAILSYFRGYKADLKDAEKQIDRFGFEQKRPGDT